MAIIFYLFNISNWSLLTRTTNHRHREHLITHKRTYVLLITPFRSVWRKNCYNSNTRILHVTCCGLNKQSVDKHCYYLQRAISKTAT